MFLTISLAKSEQDNKVAPFINLSKSYVSLPDSFDFVKPLWINS